MKIIPAIYSSPAIPALQRFSLIWVSIATLSSCANLAAIREFAAVSTDATAYTALTKDYVASPRRQKLFQPDSNNAELDRQSAARKKQEPGLLALHSGISKYLSAMGELAADELVQYDSEVDSLSDAVSKAKIEGVNASSISAFGALTKLVAKAATDGYRQKHLKEMIASSNADFQKVVKSMEFIIGKAYVASLNLELDALNKRYETIVQEAANSGGASAALYLVKKDVMQRQDDTEAKIKACVSYVKTLAKIREGHQNLNDNLHKIAKKEVIRQIKGYKAEVQELFKAVKELTKQ